LKKRNERPVLDNFDDDEDAYLAPRGSNPRLPWILLLAGWGCAVALMGGSVAYLWLASDSIMDELKDQRPQITITVKPKKRIVKPAPQKTEMGSENADTEASPPSTESGQKSGEAPGIRNEDLKASLSKVLGKPNSEKPSKTAKLEDSATSNPGTPAVDQPLHPHPDLALVEESDQGPLPKIGEKGRQPWRVYGRPFNKADKRSQIALVVAHLGLSPQQTQQAITELPASVTLGFAPYARSLSDWVQQARDNGHEVLIGLPMEPSDYPRNDPGPNGLMLANTVEENIERLNWILSRATGYVGVFNFMGSRFSVEKNALKPILRQLKNRGLLMLDTRASAFSVMAPTAQEVGLAYTVVDITPDAEPNRGYIDRQLAKLTELAIKNKHAVAIVRPFPITMLRLKRWIGRLDTRKVVLAPLSSVIKVTESDKPNSG
jgi:polysaccharide deacetylase 2 family uncharacterized protein YibQ